MCFNKNVNPSTVNDYHWSFTIILLLTIKYLDLFTWLINYTNKSQCNLILKIDGKMSKEKYWFFYDSHIGLKYKLLFQIGLNVFEKIFFFTCFEWNTFELILFLFDVMFHFVAKLSWKLIMISEFIDSFLIIIEFLVFLLYFIKGDTNNVNHITEDSCSKELNEHNKNNLNIILWC